MYSICIILVMLWIKIVVFIVVCGLLNVLILVIWLIGVNWLESWFEFWWWCLIYRVIMKKLMI